MSEIPVCVVIKKHRKCLHDNCNKQPSFGLEKLKPLYCSEHKLDNMKNVQLISQDLNFQPLVFIRFNPDEYYDENQSKISSCFITNKKGILSIDESSNWNHRLEEL
jgi:hypothetical protein